MNKKIVAIAQNTLVFFLSLFVAYVLAEWAFLRFYTSVFPIDAIPQIFESHQRVLPVLQTSKKHFIPKNYIAITGDSYAVGVGDAYLEDKNRRTPRYSSAHIIQDLTGRDVISYGIGGSNSVRGMITNPVVGQDYIRQFIDADLKDPEWLLIYFYEGNDLADNWIYYTRTFEKYMPGRNYNDDNTFNEYIDQVALGRDHDYLSIKNIRFQDRLFLYRYGYRLYVQHIRGKKFFRRKFPGELPVHYTPDKSWEPVISDNPLNRVMLNNQVTPLADNLQGPALDLSPEQLSHTLGTVDKSLAYTAQYFHNTKIAVIYIPSVLTIYNTVGETVNAQNYFTDEHLFPRAEVDRRSDWIRNQVAGICKDRQVIFVDTTNALKTAAKQQIIHGPKDWNHLNARGYQVLGQTIVNGLTPYWENQSP